MNVRLIIHLVGMAVMIVGLSMGAPLSWSLYYGSADRHAFIISMIVTIIFGAVCYLYGKQQEAYIRYKEGFAIVTFTWIFASLFGSLPFIISGALPNFSDAFFETMSGFSTTGASVLTDIESMPPGILFWRSLTHWLGGMGIVVLFIAILSSIGAGGFQIFKAESTGITSDKVTAKISDTAKVLWITYILLTIFQTALLYAGKMDFFDALCHSFGTVATGGFSTKNLSIGHYDSLYIHWVITLFMFLSGINFALYYLLYRNKKPGTIFHNEEFRLYSLITGAAVLLITLILANQKPDQELFTILSQAAFQVVSVITTTGYATADFNLWPESIRLTLFSLMFVGGCAGSTGGSIKVGRHLILIKQSLQELNKVLHPRIVSTTKISKKVIDSRQTINILQFFFMFMVILFLSAIVLSLDQTDFITALTAAAATLTNVGPGLGMVGPAENYAFFGNFSKIYMSFLMLLGRLELYTVLVLFIPTFWKK